MKASQYVYVNIALGALTAVTNGGAAMMMVGDTSRWSAAQVAEAILFAAIGFALVVFGALAVAGKTSLPSALKWQAGTLAGLLCLITLWGATLLLQKPAEQVATSWMVGILSGLAIYLFFLARQAFDSTRFASLRPVLLTLCAVAIVVDMSVFRLLGWF